MNIAKKKDILKLKKTNIKRVVLHLNLTTGKALSNIKNITKNNQFLSIRELLLYWKLGIIKKKDIIPEIEKQIKRFKYYFPYEKSFDAHKHFFYFDKNMAKTILSLMKDFGFNQCRIPIEYKINPFRGQLVKTLILSYHTKKIILPLIKYFGFKGFYFIGQQFCGNWTLSKLRWVFSLTPKKTLEIMIHPGFVDKELLEKSSLTYERFKDYTVFYNYKKYFNSALL